MQEHHFSQYVAGIYRRSKNDLNRQLGKLDVRATQSDLLMFIYEHPGRQQNQISQEMSVDPSLLARDLTTLSRKGWVTRTPLRMDRRAKVITLTPTGEQLAQRLTGIMDRWWQQLFAENPTIDKVLLDQQLDSVYQVLLERDRS